MIELLLDNHIPRVWVVRIVGFIAFLSDEVYLTSSLIPEIPTTASFAVVVIAVVVSLKPFPRVLLELFGHTILLKMSYFVASSTSDIDAFSQSGNRILLLLLLS